MSTWKVFFQAQWELFGRPLPAESEYRYLNLGSKYQSWKGQSFWRIHPPSFNVTNLNIISDEFSTEFIITGASFPKDLLKQIVVAFNVSYFWIFPPDNIFTFKHHMLDFLLEIVEWRLQHEGIYKLSLPVVFIIFQSIHCSENGVKIYNVISGLHLVSPAGHGCPEAVAPEDEAVSWAQPRPQPAHGGQGVLQQTGLW